MADQPTDRVPRRSGAFPAAIAVVCLTLAGTVEAQQSAPTGPRYLSWANRTTSTTPADVAAPRVRRDIIPRRVAPSQALARPSMQPFNPPMPVSDGGLTPASAWIGPRVVPAYAPGAPSPVAYAAAEVAAPASPSMMSPAVRPAPAEPRMEPRVEPRAEAAPPAPVPPASASSMASSTVADPMAPRADAPIFRLRAQGAAPASAPASAPNDGAAAAPSQTVQQAPAQTGATGQAPARYYSVHRAAGRQPDPTVIPEPVFFDSVALDLAAPPETEAPRRDAQGRLRPVANEDPSLP